MISMANSLNPAGLAQIEELCDKLYGQQSSQQERERAKEALAPFHDSPDLLPQDQYILDNSNNPLAQFMAVDSLTNVLTTHWNAFSVGQRLDVRNYALAILARKGPSLGNFVQKRLIRLAARITKLGWFDDEGQRQIVDEATRFISSAPAYALLGLTIFHDLIDEIVQQTPGRTITQHRKIAISFRDNALLRIFKVALTTLQQLQTGAVQIGAEDATNLRTSALMLARRCLTYDFIGTSSGDDTIDVGTIQIPTSWRSVFEQPETVALFFSIYFSSDLGTEHGPVALQCLISIASVRRSLFQDDETRARFLTGLLDGIRSILTSRQGLSDSRNYHEFCRLLARLKVTYQLAELVRTAGYADFMEKVADFTVNSFASWEWSPNSIYYLLSLWSRLVASVPYLKGDIPSRIETYTPNLVAAYINARLKFDEDSLVPERDPVTKAELPFLSDDVVREQNDSLPTLARCQYETTSRQIVGILDPLIQQYRAAVSTVYPAPGASVSPDALDAYARIEAQVTAMVYMVASIIGGRATSTVSDENDVIDGELAARVFQIVLLAEGRLEDHPAASSRLDYAFLEFFTQFRDAFIADSAHSATKVFERLRQPDVGLNDGKAVLNGIVQALAGMMRWSAKNQELIDRALGMFAELANGFHACKTMISLPSIQATLADHGPHTFPFMNVKGAGRARTRFYTTLGRLLFHDVTALSFKKFMEPFTVQSAQVLHSLTTEGPGSLRSDSSLLSVAGLFRDLRGIAVAVGNRRCYGFLYDWVYERVDMVTLLLDSMYDVPEVTVAVLKFWSEFVFNRFHRLTFDMSSPNGILLFRATSRVLKVYATRILEVTNVRDEYKEKYKGVAICMQIFSRSLGGNYVNFGVFALYGDTALSEALTAVLHMALAIPRDELMAFPKVAAAFFQMLELVCQYHTSALVELPSPIWASLITSLWQGLKGFEAVVMNQCCYALDHLASFAFDNTGKENGHELAWFKHQEANPDLFPSLMGVLFHIVLFEDTANLWNLARPLLSLILTHEKHFENLKASIVGSQAIQVREKVIAAFDALMTDIDLSLETKNRDRFHSNLIVFRKDLRTFIA